jgi:hypothetical protein
MRWFKHLRVVLLLNLPLKVELLSHFLHRLAITRMSTLAAWKKSSKEQVAKKRNQKGRLMEKSLGKKGILTALPTMENGLETRDMEMECM